MQVTVEEFINNQTRYQLIDVRSPKEYGQAHIPGAVNVPLLNDEERVIVGTVYRNEGADRAKQVGLSLIAPRLPQMVAQILQQAEEKEILIYCWRGGTRSRSVCYILKALNYSAWQLIGGYKAFRRYIYNFLEKVQLPMPVFVLNGLTGVGKTRIIKLLQLQNIPALDLEGMANHRGSAFGAVGLGQARSQKDFEAILALELIRQQNTPYLIVEGEGKRIGRVKLPDFLYQAMSRGPHILLEADLDIRVARIVEEYKGKTEHYDELAAAVRMLQKKLGQEKTNNLVFLINNKKLHEAARILCTDYYDKYYNDSRKQKEEYIAVINVNELNAGALQVKSVIADYLAKN
ncbi:MAG: tRNA 2-selenouridine(34) synthase MnmH [Firmicutes bacterium]|nr:tRNA 2-selenouridine(34) synthase MnmH [Bacillota bacterium]